MNVETITMQPDEARAALRSYRRQLHKRVDAEYEAVAQGLEALAAGQAVIMLSRTIAEGGFDARGRPNLAVARADQRQVHFQWGDAWTSPRAEFRALGPNHHLLRSDFARRSLSMAVDLRGMESLPPGALYTSGGNGYRYTHQGFALVPMIPAQVREAVGRFRADRRFILFEVERWADRRFGAEPDRDPYLLRHLGGDAYAVEAAWDLTAQ